MKTSKFVLILWTGIVFALFGGGATASYGDETSTGGLSPDQIFERTRENYASMSSYSDVGQINLVMGDTVTTTGFTTRLARPSFYLIEWDQSDKSSFSRDDTGAQAVWSLGESDYVSMGWGLQKEYNRTIALDAAAASSSGGVATIPRLFFNERGGSDQHDFIVELNRLADEKPGGMDCYVLSGKTASGRVRTFWIGKKDFLIHQIRTDVSAEVMQQAVMGATSGRSGLTADFHGSSSIETFTNIVINPAFSRADFAPSIPLY